MKKLLGVFCLILAMIGCQQPKNAEQTPPPVPVVEKRIDPIKRGEYLVKAAACHECHTPFKMGPKGPQPDMSRMLSGHPESLVMPKPPELGKGPWAYVGSGTNYAYAGPWGISYAINLTPDQSTGIGIWTTEMFLKAIRTGKHSEHRVRSCRQCHGNHIQILNDEDLKAIFAYLKSIPAISNKVPDPVIAEPPAQP